MDHSQKTSSNITETEGASYKGKHVLILGLGLNEGGVGSARFFAKSGADVLVTDIKTEEELAPSIKKLSEFPNIKYHLGGHKNEDIDWADLVIKNQAVRPDNPFLLYSRKIGKKVRTDIGIFLEFIDPSKIIGVTGTKGKSTTSSLIFEVLKSAGKKVILVGNIGKSVLESIDSLEEDTLAVMEISSFQLESFSANNISPKIAVITNIYPDHLNYYKSFEAYAKSKKMIAINQTADDFLIINKEDSVLNNEDFLAGIKSKIILYSPDDLPKDFKPQIPGQANLSNIAGAFAVSKVLNIKEDIALKALENFKGVDFRMQLVKEWNGVKIYNNTTATAPEPAIESLKTFPGCILICGGMNKGLKYQEFAKAIEKNAKAVYFLEGDATNEILNFKFQISNVCGVYNNFTDILQDIKNTAKSGDVIVFSPGATSFNLFQNEFDRGKKFNEAVKEVFG